MRIFNLLALFCSGLSLAGFAAASKQPSSFLNDVETKAVVREIDNICGDTWCAGDFNYSFDQLVCNKVECYFDIKVITRNESGDGQNLNQSRPYRCQLQGFQKRTDLLRVEPIFDGGQRHTYSEKLYEAMGQCINEEIPGRWPAIYLPQSSACRDSLRKKTYYKSASHSVYAEVFYEIQDKALASAKVLTQMVEDYASKDPSCSLQYHMAFKDEVSCERVAGLGEICSLPTDLGRFIVIKDGVDSAAVIYIEGGQKAASLGTLESENLTVKLAQPGSCYTELLNLDGKHEAQAPFNSSDHYSYFVSAKNLNSTQDARKNAAQLIGQAVSGVKKVSGDSCRVSTANYVISKDACRNLGGIDVCALGGRTAGYFVVTRDAANGAFVTFIRFD